mgnify:CR=1 FL=1
MTYKAANDFLKDLEAGMEAVNRLLPGYTLEDIPPEDVLRINQATIRIGSLYSSDRPFREGLRVLEAPKKIKGEILFIRRISISLASLTKYNIEEIRDPLLLPHWIEAEAGRISLFSILARRIRIQMEAEVYT